MKNQTSKINFQKWDKWRKSFNHIKEELIKLYFARGIFERLYEHENIKSCRNKIFFNYLNNTYVVYLAMGIRRLVDRISREQNIYQLLEDIKNRASEITIDSHVEYFYQKIHKKRIENYQDKSKDEKIFLEKSCRKSIYAEAKRIFKKSLGKNVISLSYCKVEKDINRLKKVTEKVVKLADKCFAHMDKKSNDLMYNEAHKAFDILINLYNKYAPLVGINKLEPDEIVFFNNWDAIFCIKKLDKK